MEWNLLSGRTLQSHLMVANPCLFGKVRGDRHLERLLWLPLLREP